MRVYLTFGVSTLSACFVAVAVSQDLLLRAGCVS